MIVRLLRTLTAGTILSLAIATQAQAQGTKLWYAAGGVGGSFIGDRSLSGAATGELSMDTGFTGNVGIGRYFDDTQSLKVEGEFIYSQGAINNNGTVKADGDLSYATFMVNLMYDVRTGTPWVPYLGGGLGSSLVTLDNYSVAGATIANDDAWAFTWQFKAGLAYQFNPSMALTVQYRLLGTDNLSWGATGGGTISSDTAIVQNAEVGFRFHF